MNKLFTPFKKLLIVVIILSMNPNLYSQDVSQYLIGQNAWMPSFKYSGKFETLCPQLNAAGVKMIRIGGTNYNKPASGNNGLTNAQYDILIGAIKGAGAEPIVQLSDALTYQQAKDLVYYLNVTKNWGVKYWSIGNEPDLLGKTSTQIQTYITTIAPGIRDISASAIILGPDLSSYNATTMGQLLGGSSNIAGKDSKGRYFINCATFHCYRKYTDTDVESRIADLVSKVNSVNTSRTDNPLKWGLTEFNITYDNDLESSADNKVWSMYAGQLMAEVYGLGIKYGAMTVTCWATHENGGTRAGTDLGLFDAPTSYTGRSNYYHTQMLGLYKKSTYMPTYIVQGTAKVIATYDATGYQVLIINETGTQQALTLRLDGGTTVISNPLKIKLLNGSVAKEFVSYVEAYGTRLLVFDAAGNLTCNWRYCKTQSDALQPPVVVLALAKVTGSENVATLNESVEGSQENTFTLFPNPTTEGYFTLKLNETAQNEDVRIQVSDIHGRNLYNSTTKNTGTLRINFDKSWASGLYMVTINYKNASINKKLFINN